MLATLTGLASAAQAADAPLRVRVADMPPLYIKEGERWTGVDVELTEAVLKEAGLVGKYVEYPWSRALEYLESGEVDILLNLAHTEERTRLAHFIGPVRAARQGLIVLRENANATISNLDELAEAARRAGRPICLLQNAVYTKEFHARMAGDPEFARWFYTHPTRRTFPKMVALKRCYGYFVDALWFRHRESSDPEMRPLALHKYVIMTNSVYLGLSRKLPAAVVQRLESSFRKLEANGVLTAIRAKWGVDA